MKTIICALFIGFFGFAQETEFKFTKDGFTDYVVTEVAGKTQQELFKKAIDWVSVTYKNPKEVIKAQIDNDYVKITGYSDNLLLFNMIGKKYYSADYTIEISFKDGKYKFDVISVNLLGTNSNPKMELENMNEYYKSNGNIKSNYKYFPETFPKFFNDLNKNLEAFLKSDTIPSKNDKW